MPEIIRQGDPTSHGGTVLEGSFTDICHGKPIAYMGHKVSCPLCKGTFPIIEGVATTTFYGKGIAVAGMKTACGAALIATQFTDTVEWSSGGGGAPGSTATASPAPAATAASSSSPSGPLGGSSTAGSTANGIYDEQPELPRLVADGVPYLIVTGDGQQFSGRADVSGKLPRVVTNGEAEYVVYWGDEALARMEG